MTKNTPSPRRLNRETKWFLFAIVLLLAIVSTAAGLRRFIYHDDYLRYRIEQEISAALTTACRIEQLRADFLHGGLEINSLTGSIRTLPSATFTIKNIKMRVSPSWRLAGSDVTVTINGWQLAIAKPSSPPRLTAVSSNAVLPVQNSAINVRSADILREKIRQTIATLEKRFTALPVFNSLKLQLAAGEITLPAEDEFTTESHFFIPIAWAEKRGDSFSAQMEISSSPKENASAVDRIVATLDFPNVLDTTENAVGKIKIIAHSGGEPWLESTANCRNHNSAWQLDGNFSLTNFSRSELARQRQLRTRGEISWSAQIDLNDQSVFALKFLTAAAKKISIEQSSFTQRVIAACAGVDFDWQTEQSKIKKFMFNLRGFDVRGDDKTSGKNLRVTISDTKFNLATMTALATNFELSEPYLSDLPEVIIPAIIVRILPDFPFAVSYVELADMVVNYQEPPAEISALTKMKHEILTALPGTRSRVVTLVQQATAEKLAKAIRAVTEMVMERFAVMPPVTLRMPRNKVKIITPGEYGDGMSLPFDVEITGVDRIPTADLSKQIASFLRLE